MRSGRRVPVVAAVMALTLSMVGPAQAAVPLNDDIDEATSITSLPFTDQISTAEATEAPSDPDCEGAGPTVWYTLKLDEDIDVEFNTFGSDYDTTLSAYTAKEGNLIQVACNDDFGSLQSRISFDARARQTYYIMVGAWDSGPGGSLVLNALDNQFYVRVALERGGSVELQSGTAWITGVVTCKGFNYATVWARLSQRNNHDIVTGSWFGGGKCDEEGTVFRIQINPDNGLFAGGRAEAALFADECNFGVCVYDSVSQDVKLQAIRR